ncbi:magnesium transporter [Cytobacillus firmus]|jgi:magnesium transporter|uniref:Magnesium transporter MgtE n=1 Tax=Cytobacillus firmus TaxID=1399 RepID=A0AA46PAV4_CYTFI|nr:MULTISPECIES: magnesium transporter [Bacillaceae]KML45963.1 magnesium transporter MgtE [Cytobacillus firmus]MBG9443341.1 magnesium transporter MgtE [Cytobacillus firmus]MBG9589561.1 magnesium transporter MgtE [Cytobacillus firmus]MBY6050699.1 magnesium transporter [Cytobacillus firmus]MCC3645341.1 magnesium transporter [Cytobacillus oceanisediminis]
MEDHAEERSGSQINASLLIQSLQNEEIDIFRNEFLDMHPYDQASFFKDLDEDIRAKIYLYLSPEEMAALFENLEIEEEDYKDVLAEMNPHYAADMLSEMYADDAVDVLNELDKDQVVSYLTIMDDESAKEIKDLLHYEEYTAGSIMTTEFVSLSANQTVRSAMYILKNEAPRAETIYYVYVVNDEKKLIGVISLRDLIVSDDDTMISEITNDRVVSVSVGEDQEEVARKIKDYNFLAVPVVDFQNHLLGIITVDDVMDVMEEEASDDYSKLAAVSDMDHIDRNPVSAARKRLPWLIILLFLGMLTASLIGRFENTLDKVAILAVFIPLIAGMAGNTGTQALAVAVRGIATGDLEKENKWKLVIREAGTGLINGGICGILVTFIVYFWKGNFFLGVLVGVSILFTLIVATLAGALIPLLMHRMKIDPAVASGPFITTINDLISILIYFGMATLFMSYLTG